MNIIYFITSSKGKFKELKRFLGAKNIKIKRINSELDEVQGLNAKKIIEHKAREAAKKISGDFILEDTSLYINGLHKLPGPLIRWFLQELGNDGIYRLASRVGNMKARAETILACSRSGHVFYFNGAANGKIVKPRGGNDFGWGPAFRPNGASKTFGQMTQDEKDKWSMRIKAARKLARFLQSRF